MPPPFFEIGQCCGHGPLDMVPRVLLLAKLVLQFHPSPFNMWKVFGGPVSDEGMESLDMLDYHLVCRIQVLGLVLVVDDISESSSVEAEMGGKCLSEGLPVARSQPLSFDSPQSNRLDASAMEPESGAEIGKPQCAQFDAPLLVLLETVLQGGDAASPTGLVIDPEISHNRLDRRVVRAKEFGQCFAGGSVCGNEGRFVVVDFESCFGEFVCGAHARPAQCGWLGCLDWDGCHQIQCHRPIH